MDSNVCSLVPEISVEQKIKVSSSSTELFESTESLAYYYRLKRSNSLRLPSFGLPSSSIFLEILFTTVSSLQYSMNVTVPLTNSTINNAGLLITTAGPVQSKSTAHDLLTVISSVPIHFVASICALMAVCLTVHQIYCHLRNYTCVNEQRYIIRILLLIPAYAIYSLTGYLLAIHSKVTSVYVDPIHDIAEALAIYSFLALCYVYLGGEGSIMLELTGKSIKSSCFYGTCCFAGKPYTILFLRFCKVATLQYAFIKPLTSVLSVILTVCQKYKVGDFSPSLGYLYLCIVNNFTVTLALYGLLLFYFATRDLLRPFSPLLKFATIKAIIFFSFWQDILFSILEWSHVIDDASPQWPAGLLTDGFKNFLICIELLPTAIALRFAFPYSTYVLQCPPRLVLNFPVTGDDLLGSDQLSSYHDLNGLEFKMPSRNSASSKLQSLKADLLYGKAAFADRTTPLQTSTGPEPLPWDIVDSLYPGDPTAAGEQKISDYNTGGHEGVPSISASIRATMDPRDILVDAMHNFHPTYRHYTQTRLDETI